MTTTKTKRTKKAAKPQTARELAIEALRTAHASAFPGVERGSCCASDLVHDEAAINSAPDGASFVWFMSPHATHLALVDARVCGRDISSVVEFIRAVGETYKGGPGIWRGWNGGQIRSFDDVESVVEWSRDEHAWTVAGITSGGGKVAS